MKAEKVQSYVNLTKEYDSPLLGDWFFRCKFVRHVAAPQHNWDLNIARYKKHRFLKDENGEPRVECYRSINISRRAFRGVFGVDGTIQRAFAEAKQQGLI